MKFNNNNNKNKTTQFTAFYEFNPRGITLKLFNKTSKTISQLSIDEYQLNIRVMSN